MIRACSVKKMTAVILSFHGMAGVKMCGPGLDLVPALPGEHPVVEKIKGYLE